MQEATVIAETRQWVERVVIELNLCPFARRTLERGSLRFVVSGTHREDRLLRELDLELERLLSEPAIETTLLIHPKVLRDFLEFNQFLDRCDALLRARDVEGVFQIASFHPQYRFAGTSPEAVENCSNRSPYPMLHLLREDSISQAVAAHPNVDRIPEQNIATLKKLGREQLQRLREQCFQS